MYKRQVPFRAEKALRHGNLLVGIVGKNIVTVESLIPVSYTHLIPTLVLFRNGKAVDSITAPGSKAEIDRFIQEALSLIHI